MHAERPPEEAAHGDVQARTQGVGTPEGEGRRGDDGDVARAPGVPRTQRLRELGARVGVDALEVRERLERLRELGRVLELDVPESAE